MWRAQFREISTHRVSRTYSGQSRRHASASRATLLHLGPFPGALNTLALKSGAALARDASREEFLRVGRCNFDGPHLVVAEDLQVHRLTSAVRPELIVECSPIRHGLSVDRENDVTLF